jgi:hypothetical protein
MNQEIIFESVFREEGGASRAVVQIFSPHKQLVWVPAAKEYDQVCKCAVSIDIDGVK